MLQPEKKQPGTMILKRDCPSKQYKVDKFSFIFFGTVLLATTPIWLMEYFWLIKQIHLGKGATGPGVAWGDTLALPWNTLKVVPFWRLSKIICWHNGIRITTKDIRESSKKTRLRVSMARMFKGWRLFYTLAWNLEVRDGGSEDPPPGWSLSH